MDNFYNEQAPSGSIVEVILQQAITSGASDIHIDPERGKLTARLRIDGIRLELLFGPDALCDERTGERPRS